MDKETRYFVMILKRGVRDGFLQLDGGYYEPVDRSIPKSKIVPYTKLICRLAQFGADYMIVCRSGVPVWEDPEHKIG